MASASIDVVLEKLGGILIEEINKEVCLVCNFRKDFEWLSKNLTSIRSYLRDADAQSAHNPSVKRWLLDVKEIARDTEYILDDCVVQSKGSDNERLQSCCVCVFSYSQLAFRYKMAGRIKDVRDRMRLIMEDAAELRLVTDLIPPEQPSTSTYGIVHWRASLLASGSPPVAIEPNVEEVLSLLDYPYTSVIAVVGMGGVGKTFLVQNVFDRAKGRFEKSIWLSISRTFSIRMLQASLASKMGLNEVISGQMSEVQSAKWIHDRLASTRNYLIVLDNVWRAGGEYNTLAKLISALGIPLGNNSQCKIVVTTRSRDVATSLEARVYGLQLLSKEERWKLFRAFAFPDCHQNQPPHQLEGIARQVERKCARLPLAVRIVAASLAGERSSTDWESKLRQLRTVSYTEYPIMQILKLSYHSLPAHLKPCFEVLSFFPEDEEIQPQYLINMWVAEGYIPEGEDQIDIGWSYIRHLHSLYFVEINGELVTRLKVHDLLLDLAIIIARESNCAFSVEEAFKGGPLTRILVAKKSVGDDDVDVMARKRAYSASRLRTLSFSQNRRIQNIPAILLSSASRLRILDLSYTDISSLPVCVGNLKFLRFLNLRGTKITNVPECVKSNTSLSFLDISYCPYLEQLRKWIGELNSLQHLDIRRSLQNKFPRLMPKGISKLVSLQVFQLDGFVLSAEDNEFLKLEHFVNLVNLRHVRIDIHDEAELISIEDGILASLVKTRNLKIRNLIISHDDVTNLPPLSEKMLVMKDLQYLFLRCFAVPKWICGFSNLVQLNLWSCHCAEYPALQTMPNLVRLELNYNYNCKALPQGFGKPGGFPRLLHFQLWNFSMLEELPEIEDGAMPRLEILYVSFCYKLKTVPYGLELLKSLKECSFDFTGLTNVFKEGGELREKMKANNPNVVLNAR